MARRQENVPAEPFARWLNEKLGRIAARPGVELGGAINALVYELGWDEPSVEAGQRKLYRFRHRQMSGSVNGVKGTRSAEWYPRATVEEALHRAGVAFEDLYPEIAACEDVRLEPECWCPHCQDVSTPINGQCPWCAWRLGPRTGQKLLGRPVIRRKAA